MLDIRLIREQPDFVKSRLATRGDDAAKIEELLRVDAERRKAETALQQLNADRKRLSKEIGGKRGKGEATEEIEARVREAGAVGFLSKPFHDETLIECLDQALKGRGRVGH